MKEKLVIIATRGLPGSGKSSWAKKFVQDPANHGKWKRVNNDDLRLMLAANRKEVTRLSGLVSRLTAEGSSLEKENRNLQEALDIAIKDHGTVRAERDAARDRLATYLLTGSVR